MVTRYSMKTVNSIHGLEPYKTMGEDEDGRYVLHSDYAALQAENDRLRTEAEGLRAERMVVIENHACWKARAERLAEALDIIARVGKASRKQTTRTRWIVASAISALDGNEDWQVLPKPKGFHNAILPAAAQPTKGEGVES